MKVPRMLANNAKAMKLRVASVLPSHRRHLVVFGNCQADALRRILTESPEMVAKYKAIRLPGVHEIDKRHIGSVRRAFKRADVVILQSIKDNYRGMPIGSAQLLSLSRNDSKVIVYPSMFYRGLHPYLVYVHADGPLGTSAPLTGGYHDLRFIYAASTAYSLQELENRRDEIRATADFIQRVSADSLNRLKDKEAGMEVAISSSIEMGGLDSFHTVNHPSNSVLISAADQIHRLLGTGRSRSGGRELLADVSAPIHPHVAQALGLAGGGSTWRAGGRDIKDEDVMREHVEFYRLNSDILRAALAEHAASLTDARFRL